MSTLVQIEKFRKNGLRFTPSGQGENYDLPIELAGLFQQNERDGFRVFAIDLLHVQKLTEEMAVLLIETTARLRRRGGELYILNLHDNLQEDLALFRPHAYLAVARQISSPARYEPSVEPDPGPAEEEQSAAMLNNESGGLRKKVSEIELAYHEDEVYKACDFVVKKAEEMGFHSSEMSRIRIAVYEACLNAVQHSNKAGIDDNMTVEVETMNDMMQINVYDRGRGFHVDKTREYDVTEAASHRKTGGMGLHIIRKAMDNVDYQMDPIQGNKLVMVKYLKK